MPWQKLDQFLKTDSRYLFKNSSWIFITQIIMMVFSLLSAYVFANYITPEEYGSYKYILSILTLCGLFTLTNMDTAVIEGVAKNERGIFISAIRQKITYGLLGMVCSLGIGTYYYSQGNATLGLVFLLAALTVPIFKSVTLWQSFLVGKKDFRQNSFNILLVQTTILIATVSTLYITRNIYTTLSIFIVSHIISHVATIFYLSLNFDDLFKKGDNRSTIIFGRRLSFISFFAEAVLQADKIILWHFLGPFAMGQYVFTQGIHNVMEQSFKSITKIAYPKLAYRSDKEISKHLQGKILRGCILLLPIIIVYIISIPYLFTNLFPQYEQSSIYAQAMALMLLFVPGKLFGVSLLSRKNKRPVYILRITDPLIRLISLIIFIPIYGIWGAIFALYASRSLNAISVYFFFSKLKKDS